MRRRLTFPLVVQGGRLQMTTGDAATAASLVTLLSTEPTSCVLNRRLGVQPEYNVPVQKALTMAADLRFQAALYEPRNTYTELGVATQINDVTMTATVTLYWAATPLLEVR